MRRLLQILAVAALIATFAPTAADAGAGAVGRITFVHAATYDGGPPIDALDNTVCLGDTAIDSDFSTGDTVGPDVYQAGTYTVKVLWGFDGDCTDASDWAGPTFPLADGDDVTVMLTWNEQPSWVVLPNDTRCVDANIGRLTARHAAYAGPVEVWGTPPGGTSVMAIPNLAPGSQVSLDLSAGTYTEVEVREAGTDTVVLAWPTLEVMAGQQLTVYLVGGNDGDVGFFTTTTPVEACPVESTTSTTEQVASTTAAPTFTG